MIVMVETNFLFSELNPLYLRDSPETISCRLLTSHTLQCAELYTANASLVPTRHGCSGARLGQTFSVRLGLPHTGLAFCIPVSQKHTPLTPPSCPFPLSEYGEADAATCRHPANAVRRGAAAHQVHQHERPDGRPHEGVQGPAGDEHVERAGEGHLQREVRKHKTSAPPPPLIFPLPFVVEPPLFG